MNTTRLTSTLLAAGAAGLLAASPAIAHGPGGGGPRGDDSLLDNDLSLTSTQVISSAGKTTTHTSTDDDGDSHTITKVRGAKASGAVTSDIQTAAGGDPGDLAGALRYTTRSSGTRGSFTGILTVTSANGKLRLRINGRSSGDGDYDASVRAARGTGDFADVNVDGDVDVTVSADSVAIDLDGQYGYGDDDSSQSGDAPRGGRGDCPGHGGQGDSGSRDPASSGSSARRRG